MSIHIVCPECEAVNRADLQRATAARCGQCHRPLFVGQPVMLNSMTFDRHAQRSGIPLLIDFWAPWCGPCRSMAPAFEKAAQQLEPAVRLAKVNTEDEPALAQRFAIRSIPTLVLLAQGREVARQAGAMSMADIVSWTRRVLATLPQP